MVFENISFRDKFGEERKLEFNNFYCVDCMEVLKLMPDKSIDLCIVDPPYGIGIKGKVGGGSKKHPSKTHNSFDDTTSPPIEYFNELIRISKNQIIWGANHFISKISYDSSCWIVWDKDNGNSNFADCELAWTSFVSSVRKFKYTWDGFRQGDMKNKEHRIHPTQKPIALYEWLLNNYAKKGDKILDTHTGSASSLIACYNLGFDYVGFELDKDYYEQANKRLENHKNQLNMFNDFDIEI